MGHIWDNGKENENYYSGLQEQRTSGQDGRGRRLQPTRGRF